MGVYVPITEVKMYRLTCDGCNREVNDEFYAWMDQDQCIDEAMQSEWTEHEGKYYCWDCIVYDEETDEYVPKAVAEAKGAAAYAAGPGAIPSREYLAGLFTEHPLVQDLTATPEV